MCYPKPGPRCSSHALAALVKANNKMTAIKNDANATDEDKETARIQQHHAYTAFLSTPAGLKHLETKALVAEKVGNLPEASGIRIQANNHKNVRAESLARYSRIVKLSKSDKPYERVAAVAAMAKSMSLTKNRVAHMADIVSRSTGPSVNGNPDAPSTSPHPTGLDNIALQWYKSGLSRISTVLIERESEIPPSARIDARRISSMVESTLSSLPAQNRRSRSSAGVQTRPLHHFMVS